MSHDWLTSLGDAYAVHNVIASRPELSFYVVRWDGAEGLEWRELGDPRQRLKPFHFEMHYGKEALRDRHYLDAVAAARAAGRPILRELGGFADLFYALPCDPARRTFVFAGQFCRDLPDADRLGEAWRALTGLEPTGASPDYLSFVRMALSLPVLDDALVAAFEEFLVLLGEHLAGGGREVQARVDALNARTISRLWPIEDWVADALSADKFHLTPWRIEGGFRDWMREGMGLERLPTTAMALVPLDDVTAPLDPARALVQGARLQRACIALAREMPETGATALGDYGVAILTSVKRGKNATAARLELRERAQRFQREAAERLHVRTAVGIGPTLAPGAPLHPSLRDAVLALHLAVQLERDVVFHDEHAGAPRLAFAELGRAAAALGEALQRGAGAQVKLASDRWVELVLRYAGERTEVARALMLAAVFQLWSNMERQVPMPGDARDRFVQSLVERLEQAPTLPRALEGFRDALGRLGLVAADPWQGPKVARLEATLQYLHENFAEPLPLARVARKAGFSVPAFSRAFRQATGTSFLVFLRRIRVEHAKKLLLTTPMSIELVAQQCGFQSQHHLIRSFKKVTASTPGAFRRDHTREDRVS